MWSAIVNVMTKMFDALHSLIVSLGVSENAEGVSYVLAIVLFTAIIRLLILPLNIKATKSNAKMLLFYPFHRIPYLFRKEIGYEKGRGTVLHTPGQYAYRLHHSSN